MILEKAIVEVKPVEKAIRYRDSLLDRLRELKHEYGFELEYNSNKQQYIISINNDRKV